MTDHAPTAPAPAPKGALASLRFTQRSIREFFQRNLTPKTGTALVAWRVEAWLSGPVALALVASLGRWNGALATGLIMAAFSAFFLFMLDGEIVLDEVRRWVGDRDWGRSAMRAAERRDNVGVVQRAVSVPATIMLMGPFLRAVTYHIFRVRRPLAYGFSITGQVVHSLFWTGIVLGSLYGLLIHPALSALWDAAISPVVARFL
ncbi:MAG TPA: hypothetical protein VMT90_05870 [Dehalococcoidia bacterium]|jgi:hypothetical protein|nr:hypothetical protein [Dehalococcoidia bacterium]